MGPLLVNKHKARLDLREYKLVMDLKQLPLAGFAYLLVINTGSVIMAQAGALLLGLITTLADLVQGIPVLRDALFFPV